MHVWVRRRGDHEGARIEAERALALNPNLARGHSVLGNALIYSGRPMEGLAAVEKFIRLDPRDPGLDLKPGAAVRIAAGAISCRLVPRALEAPAGQPLPLS